MMFAIIDDGMLAFREDHNHHHHPGFNFNNGNGCFGIYHDGYYYDNEESMKNIISSKLETLHTLEFCHCDSSSSSSSSSSSVLSILSSNKLFATTILQSSKQWSKIRFTNFGFNDDNGNGNDGNDNDDDNSSNDAADNNALRKRKNSLPLLLKFVLSNIRNVNSLEFDRIHPRILLNDEFDMALEEGLGLLLRQSNHHNHIHHNDGGGGIKAFSMNNINNIPSSTIISMLKGSMKSSSLEELHFTNSNFDNPTTIFGSQQYYWKDVFKNIKKLNLFSSSLSDSDSSMIIQSIIQQQQPQNCFCSLTHLDLADNHCTNQTLYELDTFLKMTNCKLETLNLSLQRTDIPPPPPSTRRRNSSNSNSNRIVRSAAAEENSNNSNNRENDTTTTVAATSDDDYDNNNNMYWDITKMISGLSQNQSLKTLYLRGNILNDVGISTLVDNCLTNPTSKLQKLMLTDCQLSIRSYQYLVKQISNFTNLKWLWINGQQSVPIKRNKRKAIVTAITNSLRQNTSLWELYLPFSLTADNNSNAMIISSCPYYNNHNPYQYYLDLNQGGRKYVTTATTMGRVESQLPPSLWSLVLERVNTYNFTPSSSSVLGTNGSNRQGGGDNNNNNNGSSSSSQMMACRRINVLYFLLRQTFLLEC